MYAALNSYDHVASGTTDLLGIDIKVTGFDGEAGNNKNIQVIVDTSLGSDQTSFVGNTLTVLLSKDLTTTDGSGVVSHNYKISDIATLINSDADFSATFSGVDADLTTLPATAITKDGTSDQRYLLWNYTRGEIRDIISGYYDGNKSTAYFRDVSMNGSADTRFTGSSGTTAATEGIDEEIIKYSENDQTGTITISRQLTASYDSAFAADQYDGFEGYKQQTLVDAFDDLGSTDLFSSALANNPGDFLNTDAGARNYTSYSVGNAGSENIHTADNLNAWMGRDAEVATYEEDVSSKKITIKLSGTEATPDEVARAYTAYINTKTLDEFNSDDAAYKRTDLSAFMAPAVLDQTKISGGGTPTPLVQEIVGKESGAGGSGSWNRASEYDKLETEKASENIAMSNNLTVRVLQGERNLGADSGRPVDDEDSYQLKVHYRPPEKDETDSVGGESDLQVPILALGLGLLRDSQKVEFDVGGLHLESESAGTFKLDIIRDTSLTEVTVKEFGFTIQIQVPDYSTSVVDIVEKVNDYGGRFSASGSGSLGINSRKIESNTGYYGKAISFSNAEEAQRAFENMTREISDLTEQVDQLAQNMSKVNMSADHVNRQIAIRKDMGKEVTEGVLQGESIAIKEFEILRDYHMSLLHKVMRVNEDMVRMLVLK
jgi:archaellum component FlaG (FlaF/FlaG flagellin family)